MGWFLKVRPCRLTGSGKEIALPSFTTTGLVATTPRHLVTQDGTPITSFRMASPEQKADGSEYTNWFTITAFNQLAIHLAGSINKGERVLVTGDLMVRDWDNGERAGTSVEIVALSVGHDLRYGTAVFSRTELTLPPSNVPPRIVTDSGVTYVL